MRLFIAITFVIFQFSSFAQEGLQGCATFLNLTVSEVCSSQGVVFLEGGTPSGGTYSGPGVVNNLFFPSIAGPGEIEITYTPTQSFCPSAVDIITVLAPAPIILNGDMEICIGESTQISASGVDDIEWSTGEFGTSVVLAPTETSIYTVYGYDSNLCISSADFTVVVDELPEVTISGNTDICVGATGVLEANGAVFYSWSNESTESFVEIDPTGGEAWCVMGIDNNGCSNEACVFVIERENPIISIDGESTICEGSSTELTGTGGVQYDWSNGAQTPVINVLVNDDQIISVTGYSQYGCAGEAEISLTSQPLPTLEIFGDATVCYGTLANLAANSSDAPVIWNTGDVGASTSILVFTPITVTAEVTGENGCTVTASSNINVLPSPNVNIEINSPTCIGTDVVLTATGANNYTWFDGTEGAELVLPLTENILVSVTGIDAMGCTATQSVGISVEYGPELMIESNEVICAGETVILAGSGGYDLMWNNEIAGDVYEFTYEGLTTVSLSGYGENGCMSTLTYNVGTPADEIMVLGETMLCLGDGTTLEITGLSDVIWNDGTEGNTLTFSDIISVDLEASGTNSLGCPIVYPVHIEVTPFPELNVDGDSEVCLGESLEWTASGADEYEWSVGGNTNELSWTPEASSSLFLYGSINGCMSILELPYIVNLPTNISFSFQDPIVCDNGGPVFLDAAPIFGLFSGVNVTGDVFDPSGLAPGLVAITYTYVNEFGCTSSAVNSIEVDDCSGVSEYASSIQLYPNPATDNITIECNATPSSEVRIFNMQGQMIWSEKLNGGKQILSIAHLAPGMYFVELNKERIPWMKL